LICAYTGNIKVCSFTQDLGSKLKDNILQTIIGKLWWLIKLTYFGL
jgi:hypothetical protein